jgi:hypothetical protein
MIFIINQIFYNDDADKEGTSLLGYMTSEESAIKKVARLNELHEQAKIFRTNILNYISAIIEPSVPDVDYEEGPILPKWKSGIHMNEVTEEMRSERNRIQALRNEASKIYFEKSRIRTEQVDKLTQEYIESLNIPHDVMKMVDIKSWGSYSVSRYEYKKIEELI